MILVARWGRADACTQRGAPGFGVAICAVACGVSGPSRMCVSRHHTHNAHAPAVCVALSAHQIQPRRNGSVAAERDERGQSMMHSRRRVRTR